MSRGSVYLSVRCAFSTAGSSEKSIVDPDVYALVRTLKRRRGSSELLAYRNGRGWVDVRSDDINDYIKEVAH